MSAHVDDDRGLQESEIFHILGNDRRREIVAVLSEHDGRIGVSEVANAVASREVADSESVPNNLYKSVYVSLQQTHLPQLEADDVVVYDTEEKTIRAGPHFEHVREYIGANGDVDTTTLGLVFATAVAGLVLVGLSGAGVPLFALISPVSWATLSLLAISVWCLVRLRTADVWPTSSDG